MQTLPSERTARDLLDLARRDKPAAEKSLALLSPAEQVALVCETPPPERARVIELAPEPEALIAALPPAELCFALKGLGLADSAWMLEHASAEQVVAALDLDAWRGTTLDVRTASEWLAALAGTSDAARVRAVEALDLELVTLALRTRIHVEQKPSAEDEDWVPPDGGQTLEGQFYFVAIATDDDLADVVALLRSLFERAYWTYFRLMLAVAHELSIETEEWALRWRTGRLEDLGFPAWDEAIGIYRFLAPERRDQIPEHARPLELEPWSLPIWLPQLPDVPGAGHRLFQAMAGLSEEARRSGFYAFLALANRVAVADRMPLGDSESTPHAIEKAARVASLGLAHLAERHRLTDTEVLERLELDYLFRLGANLDPEGARPPRPAAEEADDLD